MADTRSHRGPDPRDDEAFGVEAWPALRAAVAHLSWLLEHGYAVISALKLVGDRWSLTDRQRMAVRRSACSDSARVLRLERRVAPEHLRGRHLMIDGFNVLTTVEAAVGGAVVLRGRDGCDRDLAGVHGTYRKVEETRPAIELIGGFLSELGLESATWLLDSPVSNSGRLASLIRAIAAERDWSWTVELVLNPDPILSASTEIIATADSAILDRCTRWTCLARAVIESRIAQARVIDLASSER